MIETGLGVGAPAHEELRFTHVGCGVCGHRESAHRQGVADLAQGLVDLGKRLGAFESMVNEHQIQIDREARHVRGPRDEAWR